MINPFDFFIEDYAENYPFRYPPDLAADLQPYLDMPDSRRSARLLDEWLAGARSPSDGGSRQCRS